MVFSDITTGNGVIQECERITQLGATGISGNTARLKDFTARVNNALDRFYALVFSFDEQWNYDDSNQDDLPIATTNLVSGQQDYLFADELLIVNQVFVKDQNGRFNEIFAQVDRVNPVSYTLTSTNGVPKSYELVGNSILLDPIPSYNSSAGLKVTFKRNGVKFSYTDGGVALGIPSLFHSFLAREASLPYLVEKRMQHKNDIAAKIGQDEESIKRFMSNRAKPKSFGLRITQENNR